MLNYEFQTSIKTELDSFTHKQKDFYNKLSTSLDKSITYARTLVDNPSLIKSEESGTIEKKLGELSAGARLVGLLPTGKSTWANVISLVFGAGKDYCTAQRVEETLKKLARVRSLAPDSEHTVYLKQMISVIMAKQFAEQIEKLSDTDEMGITGFATYVCAKIIKYIQEGAPFDNRSTLQRKLTSSYNTVALYIPHLTKIAVPKETRNSIIICLDAIMRHDDDSDSNRLESRLTLDGTKFAGPSPVWYPGELIAKSGVNCGHAKYALQNGEHQKYGFRFVPTGENNQYIRVLPIIDEDYIKPHLQRGEFCPVTKEPPPNFELGPPMRQPSCVIL